MRMWMVNPKIMCRKHLLGEHVELLRRCPECAARYTNSIKGECDVI